MSRRHISQREAHALSKRVDELERERDEQRSRWASDYPGGTHIGTLSYQRDWFSGRLEIAHALKHAIVVKPGDCDGKIYFYALPLP
ncbi:MAG: hypothetical protein NUV63_12220 [Gallionella sp.]|nr:hypothetical protein [Gallionella sp.]